MFNSKLLLCSIFFSIFFSHSVIAVTVQINTDIWPPYINEKNKASGMATNVIELIARNINIQIEWQYTPYEFSYYLIEQKNATLAFPYFKTSQRTEQVLFSDPIFSVTSYLYYNRQYFSKAQFDNVDLNTIRIGKVAGYSYGEKLDEKVTDAISFYSEQQALLALLNNEIDLLPMTEEVMKSTLKQNFPERVQLIRALEQHSDQASLYLIASDNKQGKITLDMFNQSLKKLKKAGIKTIETQQTLTDTPADHAKLITAEGYPAIIGQSNNEDGVTEYFALPNGTKVIVINWSNKIKSPSSTDRLYKNMMDLSDVVILNGPHAGKVMSVRNMHIELL